MGHQCLGLGQGWLRKLGCTGFVFLSPIVPRKQTDDDHGPRRKQLEQKRLRVTRKQLRTTTRRLLCCCSFYASSSYACSSQVPPCGRPQLFSGRPHFLSAPIASSTDRGRRRFASWEQEQHWGFPVQPNLRSQPCPNPKHWCPMTKSPCSNPKHWSPMTKSPQLPSPVRNGAGGLRPKHWSRQGQSGGRPCTASSCSSKAGRNIDIRREGKKGTTWP